MRDLQATSRGWLPIHGRIARDADGDPNGTADREDVSADE